MKSIIDPLPTIQTEQELESLFSPAWSEQHYSWYKDIDGEYNYTSYLTLNLLTKNCSTINKVIGKTDHQLQINRYHENADAFIENDKYASENGSWFGIEACRHRNRPILAISYKKAIMNKDKKIAGVLGYILNFIEADKIKTLVNKLDLNMELFNYEKNTSVKLLTTDNLINLTRREAECLYYTLRGKTAKSIALILNISPKTVEFHIEQLKNKFEVMNKSQLMDKAIELGYGDVLPVSFITNKQI
ncbi:MAG: helix-turn-helix transcriptional regulator [Gammaproteobacteria bacterium]